MRPNDAAETVLAVPHNERDLISNVHLKQERHILRACNSVYLGEGVNILQHKISNPEYAFLFAGRTIIGDEMVSDDAMHDYTSCHCNNG